MKTTPPPFYTFTGNLLAEHTLTFDEWSPGRTQRARLESFQVGGKGINVSRMLRRLGSPSTILCFAGGSTGEECLGRLRSEGLEYSAFPAEHGTRSGTVVRGGANPETTFLGPDMHPGAGAVRACADFLDAQPAGVLAVCGSIPGWEDAGFEPLRAALDRWLARGTLIADTYGPPLSWFAQRPLALVKVNRGEFDGLFPDSERKDDVTGRLRRLRESRRPRAWVVTDGPGPVRLIDAGGKAAEWMPPKVHEISATGSGDVFLACVLHAHWSEGRTLEEAVAFALPRAAAHAAQTSFLPPGPSR